MMGYWNRSISMARCVALIGLSWMVAAGCAGVKKEPITVLPPVGVGVGAGGASLVRIAPGEAGYPSFADDMDFSGLEESLAQSLAYYRRLPAGKTFDLGGDRYPLAAMVRSATDFLAFIQKRPTPAALSEYVRTNYQVYRSTGNDGEGSVLFTGYYEAALTGHGERTDRYRYPVLSRPDDLVTIDLSEFPGVPVKGKRHLIGRVTPKKTVVPYYARKEVGDGTMLLDRSRPLAWVDDAVDLFFLEIQGSGIIAMENGEELRVHYETKNGHPYRSIGSYLIKQKAMKQEEVSMQSIRQWLKANPKRQQEVFNYNPSMVFFKEEAEGPIGCYGVRVIPYRSIATQKSLFPAAGIAYIQTEKPVETKNGEVTAWEPFGRFVMNHDTGGAIKGAGRVDLFTGHGAEAELTAGHMKQPGFLYFLVLKSPAP